LIDRDTGSCADKMPDHERARNSEDRQFRNSEDRQFRNSEDRQFRNSEDRQFRNSEDRQFRIYRRGYPSLADNLRGGATHGQKSRSA
jgi:hypothetical protein